MHPHNASPETPSGKRRHTRACKFFQIDTCPHSAEDCDFAHIITGEPAFQNAKPCRYYMAGHCSNGVWCRYKHPLDRHLEISDPILFNSPDIRDIEPTVTQQTLKMRSPASSPKQPSMPPSRPIVQIPHASTVYAGTGSPPWPAYPYPEFFGSPHAYSPDLDMRGRYHVQANSEVLGVPPDWASPPGSVFSDDMSESDTTVLGSPPSRHNTRLTPAAVPRPAPWTMPDIRTRSGAGGFYAADSFVPMYQPRRMARLPSPESPRNRGRAASYKTKPCRFYRPETGCPNGDECTFMHDKSETQHSEAYIAEHPSLPSKPKTQQEIDMHKGFYPVSWRVIGGGVIVGTPKNDTAPDRDRTEATRSQHSGESQPVTSGPSIQVTSSPSPTIPASIGRRRPRANLGLSLDAGSLKPLNATPETPTPIRSTPHIRSTSTPPAPGLSQLNITVICYFFGQSVCAHRRFGFSQRFSAETP